MENNPFRGKPSINVQQKVEDWGKSKFKPKKFGNGEKNAFKKHSFTLNGNKQLNRKCDARPENATPWYKYKEEIVFKQREEEQSALQANMESSQAKDLLKQREINYRKSLIEQKKQEPTKWEDFNDNEEEQKKQIKKSFTNEDSNEQTGKVKRKHLNKGWKHTKNKLNTQSKTKLRKNVSKGFISNDLLNNFDSRKLSYKQNDKLRNVITKTTSLAAGCSLAHVVKDMQRKNMKKLNKTNYN